MRWWLAVLLLAGSARAEEAWPSFGSPFRFTEAGGAAIYGSVCAGCHMGNGRGATGAGRYPSLAGNERLAAAGYPIARVLRGGAGMPPFARTLSDEQVAAVVRYIRTHLGNDDGEAVTAAEVATARSAQ